MTELLFLAHRAPYPPDRGDKIRSHHVLRHLAARARVHLVAFADDPTDHAVPEGLARELASATIVPRVKSRARAAVEAIARGVPLSLTAFADPRLREAVDRVRAARPIAATYVFSGQMAQYAGPEPFVMDMVDVDSAKFDQLGESARRPMRALLRREARLLGAYERAVADRAVATLFVSEAEAALFRRGGGRRRVEAVENGIDAGFFDPAGGFDRVGEPGPLLVMTGQMDYRPNIDAATWFAREVLPRVPGARFAVVGRAPAPEVRALAGERVVVTGAVADVRPWLAAADVAVAPLRLARGVQNKVLEAMAMARPVVASAAAAEGIDHGGAIRVADGAEAQAAAIRELIADRDAAAALGRAARTRVLARYGWEARLAPLDGLMELGAPARAAA